MHWSPADANWWQYWSKITYSYLLLPCCDTLHRTQPSTSNHISMKWVEVCKCAPLAFPRSCKFSHIFGRSTTLRSWLEYNKIEPSIQWNIQWRHPRHLTHNINTQIETVHQRTVWDKKCKIYSKQHISPFNFCGIHYLFVKSYLLATLLWLELLVS